MKYIKVIILSIIFLLISTQLWAYQLIKNLSSNDVHYKSFIESKKSNELTIYEYQLKEGDTFLSISKKAKLSISALITINSSNYINEYIPGDYIFLPSKKGIFISVNPSTDLEYLINYRLLSTLQKELPLMVRSNYSKISNLFYFLPERVLTKSEYLLWTKKDFRNPVLQGQISSYFGMRISPISGRQIKHNGIDIASKSGTEIFASLSGTVLADGYHKVFGYYLIIDHHNGYKTLYGHLLDAKVKIGDTVSMGQHIAYMGTTGKSTGSHVHFEIHKNDIAIDPLLLLRL